MTNKGKIKKVFPGSNTANGFFTYYDNILGPNATRLYILKGGPGGGKSSFMKKIANTMLENGYDLEYHQCTSDNNSLDGIIITKLGIAIVDGTAPHVLDPKIPGAFDEIINLGEFWDKKALVDSKEIIKAITSRNSKAYKRVYKYLASAKLIRDNMEFIYSDALDMGKLNIFLEGYKNELFSHLAYNLAIGGTRHLFDMAYTAGGIVDYIETIVDTMDNIIYLNCDSVDLITIFLREVGVEANKKGLYVEMYHEPLVETNINTILIPTLNLALTSNKKYNNRDIKIMDLNQFMDLTIINNNKQNLKEDREIFDLLIEKGIKSLLDAKEEHDNIEKFYVSNMNFDEINKVRIKVLDEILSYI